MFSNSGSLQVTVDLLFIFERKINSTKDIVKVTKDDKYNITPLPILLFEEHFCISCYL